ncbi:MAG TPA: hypothetical protein VKT76_01255 [Bradyrhizobium sp.]|nr:hypothetical protein [Bradyrhizobium sp.]
MIRLSLMIASVLSFAFAAPAMAQNSHHAKPLRHHVVAADPDPNLPVENALRWGYSQGYSNYPSGWGGLYGDGRYPGNVISNSNPRNSRP